MARTLLAKAIDFGADLFIRPERGGRRALEITGDITFAGAINFQADVGDTVHWNEDNLDVDFHIHGTAGELVVCDAGASTVTITGLVAPGFGAGHTIQDEGASLTTRTNLNFTGAGVTVTDDAGNDQTDVDISAGTGHTIREEGTDLTTRTGLNFIGAGLTATDDAGGDETEITVSQVLEDLVTLGAPAADSEFIVATGVGAFAYESGATARISLGLVIGTDVQAFDVVLEDLAALTAVAADQLIVGTGVGTYGHEAAATLPATIGGVTQDLDTLGAAASDGQFIVATGIGAFAYEAGVTARTSLGLTIGTDVQAEDPVLTDLAALTAVANDQLIVGTGVGTYAHEAATSLPATIGGNIQDLDTLGTIAAKAQLMSASGVGVLAYLSVGANDTVLTAASGEVTGLVWAAAGGGLDRAVTPGGRLCLTSATPVHVSDAADQTTLFYAFYGHDKIPVFDGTNWANETFTELSIAMAADADFTAHSVYDVFVSDDAGTLRLGTGEVWDTNATITVTIATPAVVSWTGHGLNEGEPVIFTTTGALPTGIVAGTIYFVARSPNANDFNISTTVANAAAGTEIATSGTQSGIHTGTNRTSARATNGAISRLNGIYTNTNSVTLRYSGVATFTAPANTATFVGTILTTGTAGTTTMEFGGSAAGGDPSRLYVWNMYNRVSHSIMVKESTDNWTYTTLTWRSKNNSVTNRITMVRGLDEDCFYTMNTAFSGNSNTAAQMFSSLALDQTTNFSADAVTTATISDTANAPRQSNSHYYGRPGEGLHFLQAIEESSALGTTTWDGDGGSAHRVIGMGGIAWA